MAKGKTGTEASDRGGRRWWAWTIGGLAGAAAVALLAVTVAGGFQATPAPASSTKTVVTATTTRTWGRILVLGNGTAVYRLSADPKNRSVCIGDCAKVWPPVLLAAGQETPVGGNGITGLATISRPDGTRQVTYQGVPLYLFVGDHRPGQITGNLTDTWGRWWVVNPANPGVAATGQAGTTTVPPAPAGSGGY